MASGDGLRSIAFPAVGTGYLQFPAAVVARVMFEEVKSFSAASPPTSVTSILFVIYENDTETLNVSVAAVLLCSVTLLVSYPCYKSPLRLLCVFIVKL